MSISMCHIRRVDHLFWMEFYLAIFFWRLGQRGCILGRFLAWITSFLATFLQLGSSRVFKLGAFCLTTVQITRFILVIRFDDPLGENTVWSLVDLFIVRLKAFAHHDFLVRGSGSVAAWTRHLCGIGLREFIHESVVEPSHSWSSSSSSSCCSYR